MEKALATKRSLKKCDALEEVILELLFSLNSGIHLKMKNAILSQKRSF